MIRRHSLIQQSKTDRRESIPLRAKRGKTDYKFPTHPYSFFSPPYIVTSFTAQNASRSDWLVLCVHFFGYPGWGNNYLEYITTQQYVECALLLYGSPKKRLAAQHRVLVLDVHFKKVNTKPNQFQIQKSRGCSLRVINN